MSLHNEDVTALKGDIDTLTKMVTDLKDTVTTVSSQVSGQKEFVFLLRDVFEFVKDEYQKYCKIRDADAYSDVYFH